MRILKNIVRWTSMAFLILSIGSCYFDIYMRGMYHTGVGFTNPPSILSMVLDFTPSILLFSHIFLFTWFRSFSFVLTLIGIAIVGWSVYWLWFSGSFDNDAYSGREKLVCIFIPFVMYWTVMTIKAKRSPESA